MSWARNKGGLLASATRRASGTGASSTREPDGEFDEELGNALGKTVSLRDETCRLVIDAFTVRRDPASRKT
ncbi:hypothetical protein [Streptomyces sp. NPDC013740]|uniref:hypothetical protein n=1 Tax=Streptomyces sp. NPDC013740 TaxID=3364867 RepID=UPI0036F8CA96